MTRELICEGDAFEETPDGCVFDHVAICWKENGKYYRVQYPDRSYRLDDLLAPDPIPYAHIFPLWRDGLTEAPNPLPDGTYVKKVSLLDYDPDHPDDHPNELMNEIQVFECLAGSPHPNIATYLGCIREGEYITGIALKRYAQNLNGAIHSSWGRLDRRRVLSGVKAGLDHLHGLGYIHNDFNASNVMLSDEGEALLIDFGFTQREGTSKVIVGQPGWHRLSTVSCREDDYFALGLLAEYLHTGEAPDSEKEYPVGIHYLTFENRVLTIEQADATPTWSDDYLKPKLLVTGSSIAIENACDLLHELLGETHPFP